MNRIIPVFKIEELKAPKSNTGKYTHLFNEVGEIKHCPEKIIFSPSFRKNLRKIDNDTKNYRSKEKKFLKKILFWLKEKKKNGEPSFIKNKIAEKVREN